MARSIPQPSSGKGKPVQEAQPETTAKAKKPKVQCCVPGCENDATTRGLCIKCYSAASNLVKAEKATWESLEKVGLAKPSQRSSSPNKLLAALEAKQLSK